MTFGCLNRIDKYTRRAMELWATVLAAVPSARLLLKAAAFEDQAAQDRIIQTFDGLGIRADRLDLRGATTRSEHLATYEAIDVVLDTFPQNGGLTSWEALYMGVPIITLTGPTTPHRITHSILVHIGHADWVAETTDDYVLKAVEASRNIQGLATLSRGLRQRVEQSIGGDITRYRLHVEQAYIDMSRRWRDQTRASTPNHDA